ncbi:MAG: PepSY domain-containing protein [Bacteroidales bacterium]|nr:PepSY domain-containing protein [Candidatus Scybalocola fimicaballi]
MVNNGAVERGKERRKITWRGWHKWAGLLFSIFIILFSISGIILNHRQIFSGCEVSRWWLPKAYHINNWNQSIVKGTIAYGDNLLMWGQAGIWKTDSTFSVWNDFNDGITEGIDNRKITNIVICGDGTMFCSGLFEAYIYNIESNRWNTVELPGNDERISDVALRGSDTVVVITRSSLYEAVAPDYHFVEHQLEKPQGYVNQTTLFKTFWMLHSGELFGIIGRLVVDAMGIALIVLCLTGIIFFVLRFTIGRTKSKEKKHKQAGWMKSQLKWHNRLGAGLIVLTLILSVTGMCLRPPFMIPLVMTHHSPIPGSTMASNNVFHDKLRAIRWDGNLQKWLLSTSEGFYYVDSNLNNAQTEAIAPDKEPQVSPMGMNVFIPDGENWLVGSFSGLFKWNPSTGKVIDWFTNEPYNKTSGIPFGGHAVTGYSKDLRETGGQPVVFEYGGNPTIGGTKPFEVEMPEVLKNQPMSLWNFALELHVGRCYEPFLGSVVSVLFVFLSGLLLTLVLISGYVVYRKGKKYKSNK